MTLSKRIESPTGSFFTDFFDNDEFFPNRYGKNWMGTVPAVNVKENENNFIIEVAVPGMDKKDFKIDIDQDSLTISSVKETKDEEQSENFTRKEFQYTSFRRSFSIPKTVKIDEVKANYKNGLLLVTLPKNEEAKQSLKKEVQIF